MLAGWERVRTFTTFRIDSCLVDGLLGAHHAFRMFRGDVCLLLRVERLNLGTLDVLVGAGGAVLGEFAVCDNSA